MKKRLSIICLLCLLLLAPLLARARRVLPIDTRQLVEEKYAGWSGVLRLWVYEGWQSGAGSLSAWLNGCAARFEKGHPGVYVQPRAVDAGAIATLSDSGILPPDLLLIPPGLLETPAGLVPLETPKNLRPGLAQGDAVFAVPVALGGYLWAWNPALIDSIPADWRSAGLSPAVPAPDDGHRWDAALLSLCAADRSGPDPAAPQSLPGLELGLAAAETPAPTAAPRASSPCRLPDDFQYDTDAWRRFINGEAAALIVTQREVRRLQALSDAGRGPDWRLDPLGGGFTDQLLALAVLEKPEGDPRIALCREFLDCLLSPESQGELSRAGAFAVTDADSGYAAGDPLRAMDAALREGAPVVPPVFGSEWREAAAGIVREFAVSGADAASVWGRFRAKTP